MNASDDEKLSKRKLIELLKFMEAEAIKSSNKFLGKAEILSSMLNSIDGGQINLKISEELEKDGETKNSEKAVKTKRIKKNTVQIKK